MNGVKSGTSKTNMGVTQNDIDLFVKRLEILIKDINKYSFLKTRIIAESKNLIRIFEITKVQKISITFNSNGGMSSKVEDSDNY